jgi:MFS family permease
VENTYFKASREFGPISIAHIQRRKSHDGFLYAALGSVTSFLPLNLIQVQGYSSSVAGFTFLPFSILLATLSPFTGGIADRYGSRMMLTVGPLIVGAGFAALALPGMTGGPSAYWTTYFPGVILIGLGMGMTVAPLTSTVMGVVLSQQSGTAPASTVPLRGRAR